ncbi:MAG: hypothetical protein ACP5EQ_00780 [Candidatus Cloacimonadia bacterium]
MKRKILWLSIILCLSIGTVCLYAKSEPLVLTDVEEKQIELVFQNISIDKLTFHKENQLKVEAEDQARVTPEKQDSRIVIQAEQSEERVEIKLWLPEDKVYNYHFLYEENVVCLFSPDSLIIMQNEKPIVIYKDGKFLVEDPEQPETKVAITKEGIFVEENHDKVVIDSGGILVQSDDDKVELSGPFGKLLGKFIQTIVTASISQIGEDISAAAKSIINSDLTSENIEIEIKGTEGY